MPTAKRRDFEIISQRLPLHQVGSQLVLSLFMSISSFLVCFCGQVCVSDDASQIPSFEANGIGFVPLISIVCWSVLCVSLFDFHPTTGTDFDLDSPHKLREKTSAPKTLKLHFSTRLRAKPKMMFLIFCFV